MMFRTNGRMMSLALAALLAAGALLGGCGNKQQAAQGGGATAVKAMKVLQQDTPLSSEYAGQVRGREATKWFIDRDAGRELPWFECDW